MQCSKETPNQPENIRSKIINFKPWFEFSNDQNIMTQYYKYSKHQNKFE